jgi:tetratricopeptide (TPR) repeat protein
METDRKNARLPPLLCPQLTTCHPSFRLMNTKPLDAPLPAIHDSLVRLVSAFVSLRISLLAAVVALAPVDAARAAADATVLEIENLVQTARGRDGGWGKAVPNQTLAVGDRIRTRQRSRATLGLTGLFAVRMDAFTTLEITPVLLDAKRPKLDLLGGGVFIFSRERSGEIDIKTPAANAALRGTQLFARVLPGGRSFIQVIEGRVELENNWGPPLSLAAGEAGEASPGQALRRTAVIEATNLLQWALYYPAVIDPADLRLEQATRQPLATSLAAYQRGNLLAAVAALPARTPADSAGRLYHAGVLLAVGRIDEATQLLAGVPRSRPGRRALERMIAAVRWEQQEEWRIADLATASEALAESYYLQSRAKLEPARLAALRAVELAPQNGFARTRLAELEFSAGRTKAARAANDNGLSMTPENARRRAARRTPPRTCCSPAGSTPPIPPRRFTRLWRTNSATAPTPPSPTSRNRSNSTTTAAFTGPDSCSTRTARCAVRTWPGSIKTPGCGRLRCGRPPARWRPTTPTPPPICSWPTRSTPCAIRTACCSATKHRGSPSFC